MVVNRSGIAAEERKSYVRSEQGSDSLGEGGDNRYLQYAGPNESQISFFLEQLGIDRLSSEQSAVIFSNIRNQLVAGGERAGKSFISALYLTTRLAFGNLFWIVAKDYELARPEFNYTAEFLTAVGAIENKRDISAPKIGQARLITKTGQIVETKTADDVKKLAAKAPDGIIMAEAAQQSYDSYLKCVGRVAEKRGWVLLSGTFEGSLGWYVELFDEWRKPFNDAGAKSYSMPSWSNLVIYPGGFDDPEMVHLRKVYQRVPGLFEERCGAVPSPSPLLVFRQYRDRVHTTPDIRYDPSLPVYLAVDPSSGTNPYAVLACQFVPREAAEFLKYEYELDELGNKIEVLDPIDYCNVIDESYTIGLQAEEIIALLRDKPWWKRIAGGAIDIEDPDERKRWRRFGNVTLQARKIDVLAGIRRLQSFLYYERDIDTLEYIKIPHLRINSARCEGLMSEFKSYKRRAPVDDDREPREVPPGDQPDHSVKALWYLLHQRYGDVKRARAYKVVTTWKRPKQHAP